MENNKNLIKKKLRDGLYKKKMRILYLVSMLLLFITSCEKLPQDLQERKDANNKKYHELLDQEKNMVENLDYNNLVLEYTNLKNEIISYTADCNERGISKENDRIINEIDGKISKYSELAGSDNQTKEYSTNICSICGNEFHNRGYEEVATDVWKELDEGNQGQICSISCGRKHSQQFNDVAKKYGVDLEDSETNSSNEGQYKMGNDGRVYEQNKCSLCKGTGIEKGRNIATGETEGRICPMCEGRGVRSY
jgi:hypothetical protein